VLLAWEKKPYWPETEDLLVDELAWLPDIAVDIPCLSSSRSLSLRKIFRSCFWRSSSATEVSQTVIERFLLTKLEVPISEVSLILRLYENVNLPGLPEISQLMPCQCCLKLF
jgi:hypothetical protein